MVGPHIKSPTITATVYYYLSNTNPSGSEWLALRWPGALFTKAELKPGFKKNPGLTKAAPYSLIYSDPLRKARLRRSNVVNPLTKKTFWSFYHLIRLLGTPGTVFNLLDSVFRYLIFILSDTSPSYTNPL